MEQNIRYTETLGDILKSLFKKDEQKKAINLHWLDIYFSSCFVVFSLENEL